MRSQELGLVLACELLELDELHFGLWDEGSEVTLSALPAAQRRFTEYLLEQLPTPACGARPRVLDVGCGTGVMMERLIARGYSVDGVSPSAHLNARAQHRLAAVGGHDSQVFTARFEDLDRALLRDAYHIVLFSESFQFVKMDIALALAARLLAAEGRMVICDVFKAGNQGDGGPGDGIIRGGQSLATFRELAEATGFRLLKEEDITSRVAPTIDLVADLLARRVSPAAQAFDAYLSGRSPVSWRLARWLLQRPLRAVNARYFGGHYNRRTFERYKTYRYLEYRLGEA